MPRSHSVHQHGSGQQINIFGGSVAREVQTARVELPEPAPESKSNLIITINDIPIPLPDNVRTLMLTLAGQNIPLMVSVTAPDIRSVNTTSGNVHIHGEVGGGVRSGSGSIVCHGDVVGSVSSTNGAIHVEGEVRGGATSIYGSVTHPSRGVSK